MAKEMSEFERNRNSWKFFDRRIRESTNIQDNEAFPAWEIRLLLEILKELQHLNDKKHR